MSPDLAEMETQAASRLARGGVVYGLAAYLWWGVIPVYFKQVAMVPALEVLAHRVIWSVALLACWIKLTGHWGQVGQAFRNRRTMVTLAGSTVLIAVNWLVFIWAVANDHIMQASLGYFMNPLINVALGFVFLGERLRRWQKISVALAGCGVGYLALSGEAFPWIAVTLAFSFGFYGLLRKTVQVDAAIGLGIETALLAPAGILYLAVVGAQGNLSFGSISPQLNVLLCLSGVVTAVPLLWFTHAARRLRLSTLGFLQYLAPSLQLALAVWVYGEPFTRVHLVSFGLIWMALAIYSGEAVSRLRAVGR